MVEKDEKQIIEEKYKKQFLWSMPIEYKGVVLYPVTCNDIEILYESIYSLLYDPLRYNSQISTLPRLYFLTDILNHQDNNDYVIQNHLLLQLFVQFQAILKLVLKDQQINFVCNKGKWYLQITKKVIIDDDIKEVEVQIKAKDFDMIRKIILHQNWIDYDDTFIHEDIRQWIAEQETSDKSSRATIEDYIEVFMLQMRIYNVDDFKNVPIRRFNRIVEKALSRENYNIQMTASASGFVTFKDKIEHWMTINKKNSIYDKYFKELK